MSNLFNDTLLEDLFDEGLELGLTENEAEIFAMEELENRGSAAG